MGINDDPVMINNCVGKTIHTVSHEEDYLFIGYDDGTFSCLEGSPGYDGERGEITEYGEFNWMNFREDKMRRFFGADGSSHLHFGIIPVRLSSSTGQQLP